MTDYLVIVNRLRVFPVLLIAANSAVAGCVSVHKSGNRGLELQRVTLEDLSTEPQKFSGRVVTLSAYSSSVFKGTPFERIQLLTKNKDGMCSTLAGRSYSISKKQVRGMAILPTSAGRARQIELTGKFHSDYVVVNPGLIEFKWDGYLTDVKAVQLPDTCLLR